MVQILREDKEAKLIFGDMRREILRLIAKEPFTARKLASTLGLSSPTVSHNVESLKRSGLAEVVKTEPESHGIIQKFYRASAQAYFIETGGLSPAVKRHLMPVRIERTRGILAALSLNGTFGIASSSLLVETATEELAQLILEAAEQHQGPSRETDPECVINEIYVEALRNLLKSKPEILPWIPNKIEQRNVVILSDPGQTN